MPTTPKPTTPSCPCTEEEMRSIDGRLGRLEDLRSTLKGFVTAAAILGVVGAVVSAYAIKALSDLRDLEQAKQDFDSYVEERLAAISEDDTPVRNSIDTVFKQRKVLTDGTQVALLRTARGSDGRAISVSGNAVLSLSAGPSRGDDELFTIQAPNLP